MNMIDLLRPRWKHPDAEIRKIAVGKLADATRLRVIVETDPDDGVREAAFSRLNDQDLLVQIAKGAGRFNVRAAERLIEPRHIIDVARHAATPQVRVAAVARVYDPLVLNQIAASDEDPAVRRCARRKHTVPDGTLKYLKAALAKLEIAERRAGGVAEFCGSLDDLCGAIVADGRFQIHGAVAESPQGTEVDQFPRAAGTIAPMSTTGTTARREFVELLGGRESSDGTAAGRTEPVLFRIKIWRMAEDAYAYFLEERRIPMTRNVAAWSISSRGTEDGAPQFGESAVPVAQ